MVKLPAFSPEEDFPIDAVITWVDGEDPLHRAKLNQYLVQLGHRPRSASPMRFNSVGEIEYCIRSLLKFAPFLRHIYVVTDAQKPPVFDKLGEFLASDRDKLILVDHRQIFPEDIDCLPTFSNRSIETVLYRIPGLAEHFVYLNDDFFLVNPVVPEDWFQRGQPVIRGYWRAQKDGAALRYLKNWIHRQLRKTVARKRVGFKEGQIFSARLAGFGDKFFSAHHTPSPLRKSTISNFYQKHPDLLEKNISFRLRDAEQFSPQFLANHLEIKAQTAVLRRGYQLLYLKPNITSALGVRLKIFLFGEVLGNVKFACIQNLESTSAKMQAYICGWLRKRTF